MPTQLGQLYFLAPLSLICHVHLLIIVQSCCNPMGVPLRVQNLYALNNFGWRNRPALMSFRMPGIFLIQGLLPFGWLASWIRPSMLYKGGTGKRLAFSLPEFSFLTSNLLRWKSNLLLTLKKLPLNYVLNFKLLWKKRKLSVELNHGSSG